jgi:uncharacterized SAM-binding protein YcdF (DUF218 family)
VGRSRGAGRGCHIIPPRPRHHGPPRLLRRGLCALGALEVVALVVSAQTWLAAIGHWLSYPAHAQAADAIAVYGGAQDRTIYGADLYRRGFAPELWHTGYADDRRAVVALLLKRGLPPQAIQYLASDSTWEDARAVADLAQRRHLRRILVVTSWYHSRRAMCVVKHQLAGSGIEVSYDAPPGRAGGPDDWWNYASSRRYVLRELVKLPYYWLRYGVTFWNC